MSLVTHLPLNWQLAGLAWEGSHDNQYGFSLVENPMCLSWLSSYSDPWSLHPWFLPLECYQNAMTVATTWHHVLVTLSCSPSSVVLQWCQYCGCYDAVIFMESANGLPPEIYVVLKFLWYGCLHYILKSWHVFCSFEICINEVGSWALSLWIQYWTMNIEANLA